MTLTDELEAELRRMEERFNVEPDAVRGIFLDHPAEYEIDPETLEIVDEPTGPEADLPTAVVADAEQRRAASGVTVFTEEDVASFERRLEAAVETLAADGGPDLETDDVVTYIAGRWNGELSPGDEGVTEHFGEDVEAAHLNRVWEHAMEKT